MGRHRTAPGQVEGKQAVFSQVTGALLRAVCIALLIAMPSLMLPEIPADTAQVVIIMAILAGVLIFIEYHGRYPSIIEFRFAPPFNRLKFAGLALIVLLLSIICRGQADPTALTGIIETLGTKLGLAIDFPYSPVRLVLLMMPPEASGETISLVRTAAGISYMVSLLTMFIFLTYVRLLGWPARNGAFNVWINLPLFDPTGGGDVLHRLKRDAALNVVLGALLPFLIPAVVSAASDFVDPINITSPQTLIWTMSAWAFLPASMLMRGIAMSRIAEMIEEKRRRAYANAQEQNLQRV